MRDASARVDLVYAKFGDDLIFMYRTDAEQRDQAIHVDPAPATWGEVRQLGAPYPEWLYETLVNSLEPEFSSVDDFRAIHLAGQTEATDEEIMAAYRALPVGRRFPFDEDPLDWKRFDFEGSNPFLGGHWFTWPAQEMLSWVPQHIQGEFGHRSWGLDGDCLVLSAEDERAIVRAFEEAGYRVEREDKLVADAHNTELW